MPESRLVLGTVQLGMTYGLANTHGQPSEDEAFAILDAALAGGIKTFDTAFAYGTAEDVLGGWLATRSLAGKVNVISKMKPHVLNEYPDGTKMADIVQKEIEKSLVRLHLDSLDGYLLHSPHYIYLEHVVAGLRTAKESGVMRNIGVSTYDEAEALQAAELGVDYVQIPYNVLDQRLDRTDFFDLAKKNNVTVFARSPFLQGLLLTDAIPPHLAYAKPLLDEFASVSAEAGLSRTEAAMLFSYVRSRADHVVFGAEMASQVQECLAIVASASSVDTGWMEKLEKKFRDVNRSIVNPSLWSKIRS